MNEKWMERVKKLQESRYGSEPLYLAMLSTYLLTWLLARIHYMANIPAIDTFFAYLKLIVSTAVQWLVALNLGLFVSDVLEDKKPEPFGKMKAWLFLPLAVVVGLGLRWLSIAYQNAYDAFVNLVVIALATGKRFDKIIRLYLILFLGTLVFAMVGMPLGITVNGKKVGAYGTGYAFGMSYPNTWARAVLLVVMLAWLLYCRKSMLKTTLLVWMPFALVFFAAKCRTIALLLVFFFIAAVWLMEKEKRQKVWEMKPATKALLIALPFLCLALTIILCSHYETIARMTYDTYVRNWAKRFVQGGIAIDKFGFHLFGGKPILDGSVSVMLNGEEEPLKYLDNGFLGDGLSKGLVYILMTMAWQAFATWRGIREKRYDLVLICTVMVLMTLMEREGLMSCYNLMLLYPLAEIAKNSVKEKGSTGA